MKPKRDALSSVVKPRRGLFHAQLRRPLESGTDIHAIPFAGIARSIEPGVVTTAP
jgi:hypothetical protein